MTLCLFAVDVGSPKDKTKLQPAYEVGSMVMVDQFGYGVVRCLVEMKTRTGDLVAGIEFVRTT